METPIKKLLNESATSVTEVCKAAAMALKPGRYMSMEKGTSAVSVPRIRIVRRYLLLLINFAAFRFWSGRARYNSSSGKWFRSFSAS
jgi:hypothetical protein